MAATSLTSGCHLRNEPLTTCPEPKYVMGEVLWKPLQTKFVADKHRDCTLELIPAGDDLNTWRQMISLQYFALSNLNSANRAQNPTTAQTFMRRFSEKLHQSQPQAQVEIINSSPQLCQFYWHNIQVTELVSARFKGTAGSAQAISDPPGLIICRYTSKKPLDKTSLAKWLSVLQLMELQFTTGSLTSQHL